ncbi:MAG: DUF5924 family protein [Myxococcota bacterium]
MARASTPSWLRRVGEALQCDPPSWWRRTLPWASLASGLAGALFMERAPSKAIPVLGAGLGALVALGLFLEFTRAPLPVVQGQPTSWRARILHLTALFGSQSLLQLGLFFVLPWYVAASAFTPAQVGFLALVTVVVGVSLWDPWYESVARWPARGLSLHAVALFITYNALLPVLGIAQGSSLLLAAAVASGGTGVAAALRSRHDRSAHKPARHALRAALVPSLLPALLALGVPQAVPPAPLRLVEGGIGTALEERELAEPLTMVHGVPEQLVCWTSISAPRGLRDRLFHVWRHDGITTDRVELTLVGGREAGFRTWTTKRHFGPAPQGTWSCAVETAQGQVLGVHVVTVANRAP